MKTFYVGVKAIIKDRRGILLIRHIEGHWDVPGGRMDDDEDFADTLQREIAEELPGAHLQSVGAVQGVHRLHRDIKDSISLVLVYFLVEASIPDPVSFGNEHAELRWVSTVQDIPQSDINPEMARIIEKNVPK